MCFYVKRYLGFSVLRLGGNLAWRSALATREELNTAMHLTWDACLHWGSVILFYSVFVVWVRSEEGENTDA